MKPVYVLRKTDAGDILAIADDFERCNEEMARYPAADQSRMRMETHELLESGD